MAWFPGMRAALGALAPAGEQGGAPPAVMEGKGLGERLLTNSRAYGVPGQPWPTSPWDVDRAMREGFETNPWIYRAVDVMAKQAIARDIVLRVNDPKKGPHLPIERDPTRLLSLLSIAPNPWERALLWRYRLVAQYLLSSKGVFVEVIRARGGGIAMMDILEPDRVDILPAAQYDEFGRLSWVDPMATFRVRTSVASAHDFYDHLPRFDPNADAESQPSSVLWIRSPHPTVLYQGMSPVQAAALSVDLDKAARAYNKRFMDNDGRPGGLISVKGLTSQEQIDRIRARFEGPSSTGRTLVISAEDMEFVDTSGTPRDNQYSDTMERSKSEISMVFGVPESVMGNASGRTFDNADAEYGIFMEQTMAPLLMLLDDQLDQLTGAADDRLFLRHDLSDVWVLNRHERDEHDRAAADLDRGAITIDEYRAIKGLEPFDVPATQVLWVVGGKAAIGRSQDVQELAGQIPVVGAAAAADAGAEAQAGAAEGSTVGAGIANNNLTAQRMRALAGKDARGGGPLELEGKEGRARARRLARAAGDADAWR